MDKHRKALKLAGHAGCILLKNGAEIFRVQETMTRILDAYGATDNNVYVISNGIFATEGEGTEHALSLVRHVPLGGVNLSRIDAVNAISREICEGQWTIDEAESPSDCCFKSICLPPKSVIPASCHISGAACL